MSLNRSLYSLGSRKKVEAFAASGLYLAADQQLHLAFRVQPGQVEAHQSCNPRAKLARVGPQMEQQQHSREQLGAVCPKIKSAFKIKFKDPGLTGNF